MSLTYRGNQLLKVDDAAINPTLSMSLDFKDGARQEVEYDYDANGNQVKDLNKGISKIEYNVLNLPKKVTFTGANNPTTTYVYSAGGDKLSVTHSSSISKRTDYVGNKIYENGSLKRILVDRGYIENGTYHFYLHDHLGNNRVVAKADGTVVQTNHYYPYGMSFAESTQTSNQPYKYNGKELDAEYGLNWHDYEARMKDGHSFTTIDPLVEKYYNWSPYAYCGNNPITRIDPDGHDWYQHNETQYYSWYDGDGEREGYTSIGGKESVLGEFEYIIDGILTDPKGLNTKSLYSEGFTFDITPNDKGGLLASKERGWDFLDEFANGVRPEFSVLLSDHPYTEVMKTDEKVLQVQQAIANGETDIPGQITNVSRKWSPLNIFGTTSMAKQFIGSYRYDAFTSSDGKTFNNVISDSKSRTSFFLHLPLSNQSRSQAQAFSNTYQFYIWKSSK